jgi:RimJ/RimL family protein N-acetyltransferase
MASVPVLETDRLVLRGFEPRDFDAFAELCGDAEVMRFMGPPVGRVDAWRLLATIVGHWTLRGYGLWAVEERATGAFVGRAGLWYPEGWPGLEVGWALRREWWGRGYATEAGRAALEWAFGALGADHVRSLIHPANARSIRVATKLGERREGTFVLNAAVLDVYGVRARDVTR